MIRYVFRDSPVCLKNAAKADPQAIGEALAKVAAANAQRLEPEAVIETARNAKSPLHKHFDWDDKTAAHAHRLTQARALIRLIRVQDENAGGNVPAFVSIADNGTSYRPMAEVKSSAALQALVLRQAERDLEAFQRRYRDLVEVCRLVGMASAVVREKITAHESRVAA